MAFQNLPPVIGLSGLIGAGKTECARLLTERYGFVRVRFAGPLKAMLRALGLSEEEIDGPMRALPSRMLCGRTPRHAMQTLGTEWGRRLIGDDLWTQAWASAARRELAAGRRVVADDVRFPNEAGAIAALGGATLRVMRPGLAADGHASEKQDLKVNGVIANDGALADLARALEAALARLDRNDAA